MMIKKLAGFVALALSASVAHGAELSVDDAWDWGGTVDGYPATNAIDGSKAWADRWVAETTDGDAVNLVLDLGSAQSLSEVAIAWGHGDDYTHTFEIRTRYDSSSSWEKVYSGTSSGETEDYESYEFTETDARYVRIKIFENSIGDEEQMIKEVKLYSSDDSDDPTDDTTEDPTDDSGSSDGSWYQPEVSATWQWQISGDLNTSYDVEIYDIDLFDNSESTISDLQDDGKAVICYFSAGSYEEWRDDADDFDSSDLGEPLDGWDGENWLDITSDNVRTIMEARLDTAAEKGCDGVEPDNVDGYSNDTGFDLSYDDQLDYNIFLAEAAHERGLSVALKNDVEQVEDLVDYFDFTVNEECYQYNECNELSDFIDDGKPVLHVEYEIDDEEELCEDTLSWSFSTLILAWDLDDSYRYSCL